MHVRNPHDLPRRSGVSDIDSSRSLIVAVTLTLDAYIIVSFRTAYYIDRLTRPAASSALEIS